MKLRKFSLNFLRSRKTIRTTPKKWAVSFAKFHRRKSFPRMFVPEKNKISNGCNEFTTTTVSLNTVCDIPQHFCENSNLATHSGHRRKPLRRNFYNRNTIFRYFNWNTSLLLITADKLCDIIWTLYANYNYDTNFIRG